MLETIGTHRNQMFAAAAATIGALSLGSVLSWSSMAMPNLNKKIEEGSVDMDVIGSETQSWIGSSPNLGALVACVLTGFVLNVIGRKWTMLLLSPLFVLGWLLIAFARNPAMIIAGRVVTGFCGGGFSVAAPLFIAEMADKGIRGALGSSFQIMLTFGILFGYVFGSFLTWKWLSIVSAIVPALCFAALIFVPESPRYLVSKGRMNDAVQSLCWFRRKSVAEVEDEMKTIESSVREMKAQSSSISELFLRYNSFPAILTIGVMAFQQMSGIKAVTFYTKDIFVSAGTGMSEDLSTIIVGIVQAVATFSSIFTIDKAGRKILLCFSSAIVTLSLVALGTFFKLQDDGKEDGLGWLPLVSLITFTIALSTGYGPISWVILGELTPQKVKPRVVSIATFINWTLAFLITKFFDQIQKGIGVHWCYWLFAIVSGLGFLFILFLLPETKGKSMEEIERYFGVPQAQTKSGSMNGAKANTKG